MLVSNTGLVLLSLASAVCACICDPLYSKIAAVICATSVCAFFYEALEIACIKYIVTDEQLIFKHGIFNQSTEYLELYRVVDYQQTRSLMQQILGIKTIYILSGDKTMPTLPIIGVKEETRLISEIRMRVEYNKKRKGIYEITNRY